MKKLILLLSVAIALNGCQQNASEPSEDTAALHNQFHGQYSIVSSTAEKPVDLNRDGQASTDLSTEIPNLKSSRLLVLIRENGLKWFEESWPQPNIARNWQYSSPDSVMLSGYLQSPLPRDFTFNKEVTGLLVETGPADKANGGRTAAPESVTILGNEQLRVVTSRLLYIGRSWQLVRITTVYQRFTIIT